MEHKRLHIIIRSLLIVVLAGVLLTVCHIALRAEGRYSRLRTGGGLPAEYAVNGIDVSGKSISDARNIIKEIEGRQQVELCDTEISISEFTDIDVEFTSEDISIWDYVLEKGSLDAAVTFKVDIKRLKKVIKGIDCIKTRDAVLRFKKGKAVIIPEVYGNVLKVTDEVVEELETALSSGTAPDIVQFYKKPTVTRADLKKDLKKASKWNNYKLEITEDGKYIDTFQMGSQLKWDGKKVVVSQEWIKEKVSELAGRLNTYGKIRDFVTNDGKNIKVPGGTMGWLLNEEETEAAVYEALQNNQNNIELIWKNKGAVLWEQEKGNDIGNTYVEVSIEQQKVWYYKDGEMKMETDTVTGLPTRERETKIGVHHILYMQRDRILRGSGEWNTFVNYWMPFTLDGQGLHDASWRRKFGGTIYKSSGSHGCVNLPKDFAAQLYEELKTGIPVIVY